jgi:hypothetical protein
MLSTAERRTTISPTPPSTPRLRRQPPRPPHSSSASIRPRTLLDGGWWPRSADPVAELPGLILAIEDPSNPITRLMLVRAAWDSHPHRLRIDGPHSHRVVRLGWFDSLPAGLLTATCANGERIDLLTVPPHTPETTAQAAMEQAAQPTNHTHTPDLLTPITPTTPTHRAQAPTASESRWESEGGRAP